MTLLARLHHVTASSRLFGGAAEPIRITAASEARRDLSIVIERPGLWSMFDSNEVGGDWLGEIRDSGAGFSVNHEDRVVVYAFPSFAQALSYFMEYGYALDACR